MLDAVIAIGGGLMLIDLYSIGALALQYAASKEYIPNTNWWYAIRQIVKLQLIGYVCTSSSSWWCPVRHDIFWRRIWQYSDERASNRKEIREAVCLLYEAEKTLGVPPHRLQECLTKLRQYDTELSSAPVVVKANAWLTEHSCS